MPTKTTGAEFKRFYHNATFWPQDDGNTYHEDEIVLVNGGSHEDDYATIPDDATVTIEGGIVMGPQWDCNEPSFESYFKKWRKQQTVAFFTVEAPKDKLDVIKAVIRAAGGKC